MGATKTTSTVLGKRKTRAPTSGGSSSSSRASKEKEDSTPSISAEEAQAIFRRHFEAQFKPLSPTPAVTVRPDANHEDSQDDDDDDDESEASWSGVSKDGEEGGSDPESDGDEVEVVSHTESSLPSLDPATALLSKREAKTYLSSRVPSALAPSSSTTNARKGQKRKSGGGGAEDDEDAPSLLKNDLALRRLLSESHLFSHVRNSDSADAVGGGSGAATEHAGRNRHLAMDLRLAALGSRRSIYAQQKMPMGIRKGIAGAAGARETKRRKEARENGLVLERKASSGASAAWLRGFAPAGAKRGGGRDRDRGAKGRGAVAVDAPAVGKLRNGMLKLSKRDIREIQGSGGPGAGRGGKGGKKRRM